jgi:hypothetical protein
MDHDSENAAARERVLALVRDLSDDDLARPIDDDWTVGAELAHLAFWDQVHGNRLRQAQEAGLPAPAAIPDGLSDIINNASLPIWRAIPGRTAVRLFEDGSAQIDAYIASLDPAFVQSVRMAGMPRLIERSRHRTEHGEAIERRG